MHVKGVDATSEFVLTSVDGKRIEGLQWENFGGLMRSRLPLNLDAGAYILSVSKGNTLENIRLICQ